MVSEAPHTHDRFEVDEPTQPFSRVEIDRLRYMADLDPPPARTRALEAEIPHFSNAATRGPLSVVPSMATVGERVGNDANRDAEEWFELEGRWLRVSLQSFAHFGLNGAPLGMIGSVDASFVAGTINGQEGAPLGPLPRLTEIYDAPEPEPEADIPTSQPSSRQHKRRLWAVLVVAPVALALVAWVFARTGDEPEQLVNVDDGAIPVDVPEQPTVEAKPPPLKPEPEPEPEAADSETGENIILEEEDPREGKPPTSPAHSDVCVEHRKVATRAHDGGKWEELEALTQRRNCWSRSSEAKALRMRALFELERFRECVHLGAQGGSKEVQKWVSNCQRALE